MSAKSLCKASSVNSWPAQTKLKLLNPTWSRFQHQHPVPDLIWYKFLSVCSTPSFSYILSSLKRRLKQFKNLLISCTKMQIRQRLRLSGLTVGHLVQLQHTSTAFHTVMQEKLLLSSIHYSKPQINLLKLTILNTVHDF